jgi:hypothetical protein
MRTRPRNPVTTVLVRPKKCERVTQTCPMYRTLMRKAAAVRSTDKVVVLGSGWGGFNIALNVNKDVPLTVISPANHFLFTPLLPSSAVGTLEFRCIEEPVR